MIFEVYGFLEVISQLWRISVNRISKLDMSTHLFRLLIQGSIVLSQMWWIR